MVDPKQFQITFTIIVACVDFFGSEYSTVLQSIINAKMMQSIEEVQIEREEDCNANSYEIETHNNNNHSRSNST